MACACCLQSICVADCHLYVGEAAIVQELLAAKANIQAVRSGGFTPLHTAQTSAVARLLLDSGADPTVKADNGNTPMQQAAGGAEVQSFIEKYKPQFAHDFTYGRLKASGEKQSECEAEETRGMNGTGVGARRPPGR